MLNKFFGGIKDIWFCTKYFAKFAWKHLPIYYLYILMSVIISTAGPFVSIIGSKYLINEIVYEQNRNMNMIIFWVAFICIGTYIHVVGNKFANEKQILEKAYQEYLDLKKSGLWGSRKYF